MFKIVLDREADGRWIGEVPSLPGVMAYGATEAEAKENTIALALRVLADRVEHGEGLPQEAREIFA
jgi:predicted RNase H-like HicB family nuclease